MADFKATFENPWAGKPVGGGVTPGMEPWKAAGATGIPDPSPAQVAWIMAQLSAIRPRLGHAGYNPTRWIQRFNPQSTEDVGALFGILHNLADPELSPNDLESLAKDILREPKLARFFV